MKILSNFAITYSILFSRLFMEKLCKNWQDPFTHAYDWFAVYFYNFYVFFCMFILKY